MEFSLGLIEVSALGHAIYVLDAMIKAADVEFVATERKLGGRLVTLVVKGEVSAVTASVEAGKSLAMELNCFKASEVIARPHKEILKFLHIDNKVEKKPVSKTAPVEKKVAVSEKKSEKLEENKVSKPVKKVSDKKAAPAKKGSKKKA